VLTTSKANDTTAQWVSLFAFYRSPCHVLLAILSQQFPPPNNIDICGSQNFSSGLKINDNHLVMNFPDIITINTGSAANKLCHINLFSDSYS
jgi:hypothetical protein